jgi:hypothetical protein
MPKLHSLPIIALLLCFVCAPLFMGAKTTKKSSNQAAGTKSVGSCLPSETKLDDVVTRDNNNAAITVEQKLKQLGASCNAKNKLVAKNGKPIHFYRLTGCWGMAPQNYQEILAEQRRKIAELEKTHTVIQMTCNPTGAEIK